MDYRTIQSQFISGILSPLTSGLVGTDLYARGLEAAENAFFSPTGGVYKRNGTELKHRFTDADADVHRPRIITLKHSRGGSIDQTGYITFVIRKGQIAIYNADCDNTGGVAGTILSGYVALGTAASFYSYPSTLSIAVQDEKVYIVGKDYPPRVIECVEVTDESSSSTQYIFKLNDISFVDALSPTLAEGAIKTTVMKFNSAGNYPSIQCFYDGRWFLGATENEPTKIWCSRSYDSENQTYRYNDFTLSYFIGSKDTTTEEISWKAVDLADLACQYKNSNTEGSSLSWLYEFQGLILGTTDGIYACNTKSITSSTDNPLNFTKETSNGAYRNLVTSVGNYLIYVGIDNQTVNALAYSQQYNSFTGGAISGAVSEYFSGNASERHSDYRNAGIVQLVTVEGEVPKLYVLDYNSGLFCCHFDPANSMIAWSRITFKNYEPLMIGYIPPNPMSGHNALAIISEHITVTDEDGNKAPDGYCVWENLENVIASQSWKYPQIDKYEVAGTGKTITGTTTETQLTPYPYNPDTTYMVVFSEMYWKGALSQQKPAEFDVMYPSELYGTTLGTISDTLHYVGEGYDFAICTTRAELPANGTSQGTKRAIKSVVLRLFTSAGGEVFLFPGFDAGWAVPPLLGDITNDLEHNEDIYPPYMRKPLNYAKQPLYRRYNDYTYDELIKLYTGDVDIQFTTPTIDDDRIAVVQREPLPFTVCAIIATRAVKES